jgi:hypothetical protein
VKLHSINEEQGVYVMPCGSGFSCYGFDVLDRKARAVLLWIVEETNGRALTLQEREALPRGFPTPGTAEHFAACADVMDKGAKFNARTGKRCPAELVPALIGLEGARVEATVFGERVRFNVGRSTGWMPAHLQIHNARSHGGGALIADSVKDVRVIRR